LLVVNFYGDSSTVYSYTLSRTVIIVVGYSEIENFENLVTNPSSLFEAWRTREIFDVGELDLQAVGLAFGFRTPPRVDLPIRVKRRKGSVAGGNGGGRRHGGGYGGGSGHDFSASNPYGKRKAGDVRQFSH
jgi:hypothetical protein